MYSSQAIAQLMADTIKKMVDNKLWQAELKF